MELYELKQYILDSCEFLGMEVYETNPGVFDIHIPDKFRDEFNGLNNIQVCFEKTSDHKLTYLTFESFFTQKVAKLVANINAGVGTGSKSLKLIENINYIKSKLPSCNIFITEQSQEVCDYIYIWFKTTVRGNLIEEYLNGFKYNLNEKKVEYIKEDINILLKDVKEEILPGINTDTLDKVLNDLLLVAKSDAEKFIENKKSDTKELLEKEIKRINDYYDMLLSENQLAETSKGNSPKSELELLQIERQGLINQQYKKYEYKTHDAIVEPIAILLLRQFKEIATAQINNDYGKTSMNLRAGDSVNICCSLTNEHDGPFTITSDNLIISVHKVFDCSSCKKHLDTSKENNCKICNLSICNDCKQVSIISKASICQEHTYQCQSCTKTVASDELHLCSNCNQFYCKNCNQSDVCTICNSLEPMIGITPQIKTILNLLPDDFSAKKYEVSEKGNRVAILGKGTLFKSFFIVYDKLNNRLLEKQKYGMFNRKNEHK